MEINSSHVDNHVALIKNYSSFVGDKLKDKEAESLVEFARIYLQFFPLDAWVGRELSDLHGFLYGLWLFIQNHSGRAPKIQIFNPDLEEHGWTCGRTVIHVLQKDMPFLVDSVRLELNRRDVPIYVIQSTVLQLDRASNGQLQQVNFSSPDDPDSDAKEALIYLEVGLFPENEYLNDLRRALGGVLQDVENVVADYKDTLTKLEQTIENVSQAQANGQEEIEFLHWLKQSHFTFLGYREFTFVKKGKRRGLEESTGERLGIFKKLNDAGSTIVDVESTPGMKSFHESDDVIFFSKSATRSNVHRSVYPDYIVIKRYDKKGLVCGEVRFLGLFTYAVSNLSPNQIPLLRRKVAKVIDRAGLDIRGYYGKNLLRVIENFPKEELFQSDEETLFQNIWTIASINERHIVRLIMREDPFGSFVNFMVYVPRDMYNTHVRMKIEHLIGEAIGSHECDSTSYFSESTLARAQFVFKVDEKKPQEIDVVALEQAIRDATKTWVEQLKSALLDHFGESKGIKYFNDYRSAFSQSYQEYFDARSAVHDIKMLETLSEQDDIAMNLYRPIGAEEDAMRFKVMHLNSPFELSDVIPVLENLGLRVLAEHPYSIKRANDEIVWLHDFQLTFGLPVNVDVHSVRHQFEDAFVNIWRGNSVSDKFNRLVLAARLNWREVSMLRAYAKYLKQVGFTTTESFIADTLVNHFEVARNLVALFKTTFDPRVNKNEDLEGDRISRVSSKILAALDSVQNLNEDLVLRRYLDLMSGTLRTNYFQADAKGNAKDYISFKFSPRSIPNIPEPRPLFEIFVYSPRVEGVHLRGGKVARGGLRWSDRLQDYRTEVLGLVKAQQVKNAVIVPHGAKGGFVAKKLNKNMSRDEFMKEGIACYKIFIQSLLDLTDNFVEGQVVPPECVIRRDEDDPYLVVAADKGTATFSDIANEIAIANKFWLGDAFASGGSQGYDHKGMGITAKGAWVSVQQHFRKRGKNIQNEDFTVIGIGDMAGDVFGNGMLLSEHIRLVAAFNHMHIFIDPSPDAAKSFQERERLFNKPRSTWEDYDHKLISKGGGVFSRNAKSIKITPEMKKVFAIEDEQLPPNALISALLKAPVDLIWNGGIGTYVKASWESDADVGDKANDSLRVNGKDLRCQVFGEGGNLGMTQLGRVEFALNGGACNTDFIDNAAGVDCSDHEVNIKILLDELVHSGDMTYKQRNKLLVSMTDDVSKLVLKNNYRQTLSISMAEHEVVTRLNEYRRFINFLESTGRLDRQLEFLPSDEMIVDRQSAGKALTRPELSVLISYSKVMLKEALIDANIAQDPYIAKEVETAFPTTIRKKYSKALYSHRLKREIVGTQVANDFINNLGITSGHRLLESTGASFDLIAKAYIVSRDVFQFEKFQQYIMSLDNTVDSEIQHALMSNMVRRVRRGTRWFLRNRRAGLDPAREVGIFRDGVTQVQKLTAEVVMGTTRDEWEAKREQLTSKGLHEDWILPLSMPENLFSGLGLIEAQINTGEDLKTVAEAFFTLLDELSLNWFATQISNVRVESYWQAMARESFIDDLEAQLRKLTHSIIRLRNGRSLAETIAEWSDKHSYLVGRWRTMVIEVQGAQQTDYAMFSVAMRELFDLSQATVHTEAL